MVNNKKGFAHLVVIFIVIAAFAVVGFFAFTEFSDSEEGDDGHQEKSPIASDCGTDFFDTHAHLDDTELPRNLAQRMEENNVSCAAIFVQLNPDNYRDEKEEYEEILGEAPNVFLPFFDIVEDGSTIITRNYLEKVNSENSGKFIGFGEFALYRPELAGANLTSEPWPTIFQFASERDLFVMIHMGIEQSDQAGLEAMLARYPNIKVLIHGIERTPQQFAQLLQDHPNLYFTLDTSTLLHDMETRIHLMYPNNGGSAKQFATDFDINNASLMTQAKTQWSQVILAAPDRVMWGTDASFDWHTDPMVYSRLMSFSKEFISSLPPEVQQKYAYKNAVNLFGQKALVFEQKD